MVQNGDLVSMKWKAIEGKTMEGMRWLEGLEGLEGLGCLRTLLNTIDHY